MNTGEPEPPRIGRPAPLRAPSSLPFGASRAVRSEADLEQQLRRILRFFYTGSAAVFPLMAVVMVVRNWRDYVARPSEVLADAWILGPMLGVTVFYFVVAVLLAGQRRFTLRQLRILEGSLVGISVGLTLLTQPPALEHVLVTYPDMVFITALGFSSYWSMSILGYAVFVPNTWQRCATVVALIFVFAMGPDIVIVWRSATIAPSIGASYLLLKALWILMSAAAGVWGAFRINVLQHNVDEARKIGQYVLGRQLGSGGMGEVYLAEHQFLRRPCAVKLIRPEHGENPTALERFEREVQATAALTHPNTIQIYDYGRTDDGTFFYAMEYLPGESLAELVARTGSVSPARTIHFLAQVAGSLREAHAQGLVHRDVKPSNVIITERGGIPDFAKLLDFGLVVSSSPTGGSKLTEVGMIVGTPAFMSPEQCGGEDNVGPASDIYSVGALGYFLLSGREPFAGKTPMQMLAAHLYEMPTPLAELDVDVPAEVGALITRCLAKRPEDRFESVAQLERALLALP